MKKTLFVTAIDTGVGKTICTGLLARFYKRQGINVITQKLVQTGSENIAEDIRIHRKIMETNLTTDDISGKTNPYVFSFPASPHLAAELEKTVIDMQKWKESWLHLKKRYDLILIEGAGGLFVPINRKYFIMDWLEENKFDVILVTSPRLGSINHTFLSMDAMERRGIRIKMIIYNHHLREKNEISSDSYELIRQHFSPVPVVEFPYNVHQIPQKDEILDGYHEPFMEILEQD